MGTERGRRMWLLATGGLMAWAMVFRKICPVFPFHVLWAKLQTFGNHGAASIMPRLHAPWFIKWSSVSSIFISILQVKRLSLREVKYFFQVHTPTNWWSWEAKIVCDVNQIQRSFTMEKCKYSTLTQPCPFPIRGYSHIWSFLYWIFSNLIYILLIKILPFSKVFLVTYTCLLSLLFSMSLLPLACINATSKIQYQWT